MRILAATMAIALLLCGCVASGQQFKLEAKPDSNRALLYVYRPATIIGIGNPDVPFIHLDGRRLGRIRIGGYLAIPISPGRHKLTTTESLLGNDIGRIRGDAVVAAPAVLDNLFAVHRRHQGHRADPASGGSHSPLLG